MYASKHDLRFLATVGVLEEQNHEQPVRLAALRMAFADWLESGCPSTTRSDCGRIIPIECDGQVPNSVAQRYELILTPREEGRTP